MLNNKPNKRHLFRILGTYLRKTLVWKPNLTIVFQILTDPFFLCF
jgi:hypothetical protein